MRSTLLEKQQRDAIGKGQDAIWEIAGEARRADANEAIRIIEDAQAREVFTAYVCGRQEGAKTATVALMGMAWTGEDAPAYPVLNTDEQAEKELAEERAAAHETQEVTARHGRRWKIWPLETPNSIKAIHDYESALDDEWAAFNRAADLTGRKQGATLAARLLTAGK